MASYFDALPNSFKSSTLVDGVKLSDYPWPDTSPKINEEFFLDERFSEYAENLTGFGALAGNQVGWSFITAPEDVSWDVANAANRVEMFGTNNPPVVAGSRGMRDLTLSNALVEGFVRGVSLEGKIAALEQLMSYKLNSSDGFVSVPVYQVWASEKSYGGPEAYYIIKDIKVQEKMRDLKGNVTRALVDISLMQVPTYQVNSGRDQASQTTTGGRNQLLLSQAEARALQRQGTSGQVAKDAATREVDGRTQSDVSKPEQRTGPVVGETGTLDRQQLPSLR